MTKVDVITTSGEKRGSVSLKETKSPSSVLVSSVILANLSNKRKAIAHTKTRGEVSGGGKKPYRQKGTGSARAGSIRSPLWIGGGVTFGPRKEANFYKRINKRQKQLVLNDILRKKAEGEHLRIIEDIAVDSGKTKDMLKVLSSLGIDDRALLVLDDRLSSSEGGEKIYKSGRNIDFLKIIRVDKLNAFSALKYKWLVITKKAFEGLNARFPQIEKEIPKAEGDKDKGEEKKEKPKKQSQKKTVSKGSKQKIAQ